MLARVHSILSHSLSLIWVSSIKRCCLICVSPLPIKRRRHTTIGTKEAEVAKAKFGAVKGKFGRDLRIFETAGLSTSAHEVLNDEESDDTYEFTPEDYYRITAAKKEGIRSMFILLTSLLQSDKYLKPRKIREAEEAARRSRITKTVIRVHFPDKHTLEAALNPSEKIQSMVDL